ncbi:response regulator transcription factor [Kytococcus sedentarius]
MTVVLAEDNTLLRTGLQMVLGHSGMNVQAAVGTADALRVEVRRQRPDLVVTDVRMPPGFASEGLEAAAELRQEMPDLPVVVLSQYVELSYLSELLDSGGGRAVGYLLKDRVSDVDEFSTSLRRVAAGGTAIDPAVVQQLLRRRRDPLSRLTQREQEVLAVMAEGASNASIARRLFVTEAAVVKHVGNILTKLDLPPNDDQNRRVAAVLAHLRAHPGP